MSTKKSSLAPPDVAAALQIAETIPTIAIHALIGIKAFARSVAVVKGLLDEIRRLRRINDYFVAEKVLELKKA